MNGSIEATGTTRRLASFCAGLGFGDLDGDVRDALARSVADTLAACHAGTDTTAGERVLAYLDAVGADGRATVVGRDEGTIPHLAALVNGTLAHALDLDDGHRAASAHPGAATIPAALAVAETRGAPGRELLVAVAAGYEAMLKTAAAVQPSHRERGFHATATCGCLGAAAAAARLHGLDAGATADALGLAGTQAGGLFEFLAEGSMSKRFHAGRAAMAGVLAADLAAAGFDGPRTVIEGVDGFARAFADDFDRSPFDALGDPLEAGRTYLKPYPCCRHAHAPIDAALRLRERGATPDAIERVRVETYGLAARHDKAAVETLLDAQMSVPYAVAVALVDGEARLPAFDPPRTDGPVGDLLGRVEVVRTDAMEARYPERRPATVIAETATGRYEEQVDYPLGSPENPMSEADLRRKFDDLTAGTLSKPDRGALFETAIGVAGLDDVSELTRRP